MSLSASRSSQRPAVIAHALPDLLEARRRRGEPYFEFLRTPSLSAGLYELPRGGVDRQSPHMEDEVYHVVKGRGRVRVGQDDIEVRPGSLIFVPAGLEHRFHDILESLAVVVFFAPAEGSSKR